MAELPSVWRRPRVLLHASFVMLLIDAAMVVPMPWSVHRGPTHHEIVLGDGVLITPTPATEQATLATTLPAIVRSTEQVVGTPRPVRVATASPNEAAPLADALAALDPSGELLRQSRVAAIGLIDARGQVSTVDGIAAHVALAVAAGAELILVPADQVGAATAAAPDRVRVRGVRAVDDALAQIAFHHAAPAR